MDESGDSANSSKISDNSVDQTESKITCGAKLITESLISGEIYAETASGAGQRSILDRSIISFSFRSQSSTDSYETVHEPRNTDARGSKACLNDQRQLVGGNYKPGNTVHSLPANKHDQACSVRSSYDVSDVTQEIMLMSPRQFPPLQAMDRSGVQEPGRNSSSAFTPNSTPQKWSAASSESLFSLHQGHFSSNNGVLVTGARATSCKSSESALSGELTSNQPEMVAGRLTAKTDKSEERAGPSVSDNNSSHDYIVQQIHHQMDATARVPETSWDPRKNKGKIQPLPLSVNKKPDKPSSRCENWNCCLCSCKKSGSCCSGPRCSCCKMPSCSCCNCSLEWCCNWICCSKKTCCSSFNCCCKWSCCTKRSFCPSCSNCSKAICCWNWSCWKLFCCSNWNCCSKPPGCWSWKLFCCSKGSSCKSWSCCSKETCCLSWNCCSKRTCWNCCSKGSCCKS